MMKKSTFGAVLAFFFAAAGALTAAASRIGLHRRGVSRVRLEVISVGDGPHEVSAR